MVAVYSDEAFALPRGPIHPACGAVPLPLTGEERDEMDCMTRFLPRKGEGDRNESRPRQRTERVLVEGASRQRGRFPLL